MRRAVLVSVALLVSVLPAPASASGPPRAPALRSAQCAPCRTPALNPMAGVVEASRFVQAANVAGLRAAAELLDARQVYDVAAMATRSASSGPAPVPVAAAYTGDLSVVVNCIKGAESGNYTENTHMGSGSGAYQFIPRTWRYYFGLWKSSLPPKEQLLIPYYDLAYQAPPWVQDAVLHYALTHGGAGNWSNRYGRDNCTASLPGGG